jgi:CHASE2 domain-containing sensor protein
MANWAVLATICFLPAWLVGFFANRKINFRAAWKLAGAALMPGAALLVVAIIFYGWRWLDPVQLTAAFAAHFVIGFIYIFVAPLFTPKLETELAAKKNPFAKE